MAVTVNVQFKPPLEKIAEAIGDANMRGFLQNKIKELAFDVERESKKVTPVDTGRLRSSIYTKMGDMRATIKPRTNYAVYVHEGTSRMRGRPFMLWGVESATMGFTEKLAKEIDMYIQRRLP